MREDVDMLRGTLEVLLAVFAVHENANGQQNQEVCDSIRVVVIAFRTKGNGHKRPLEPPY